MTIQAVGRYMRSRQWKVCRIVIEGITRISRRVAGQTGRAIIRIAIHTQVLLIRLRVRMTGYAGEFRIIIRIGVAIHTGIPLPLVLPAIDREVLAIVIKGCRLPGILAMTARTVR